MSIIIKSGATTDVLTVDPTSKAARTTDYDASGNILAPANRGAVAELTGGLLLSGKDYKVGRTIRALPDGTLAAGAETLLFYDAYEGATRDSNKWVETATTMTSAQTVASGLTLNQSATTTITTGIMEASHRQFAVTARMPLVFRTRLRLVSFNNSFHEFGLVNPPAAATTALVSDGAFFRKDAAGSLQGVVSQNGTEVQTSTMTLPANTDYAVYEIWIYEGRAIFSIYNDTGTLTASVAYEPSLATTPRTPSVTHLSAWHRVYNSGTPGTAPQMLIDKTSVWGPDTNYLKPWNHVMAGHGYDGNTSPTAYTQLANYANSAAPASATLSNTAAGYTTLGGQWQFAAAAGAETDYALFGFTNPSPYTMMVQGVQITAWNSGAQNITTATLLQWGLGFNSSAVSLATAAPYTPMRVLVGMQRIAVGAQINEAFDPPTLTWAPPSPMVVQPGRFFHIILKVVAGTATASQIIRGTAVVNAYFE